MDPRRQPENPTGPTRRENQIQGPKPSPLKVSKDSHKITKKPPIPPKNTSIHQPPQHHHHQLPATGNQPLIIYSISPKPIFVEASDFRSIVQNLTGKNSEPSAFSGDSPVSPAARFASIERTSPSGRQRREKIDEDDAVFEMMINDSNNDDLGANNNNNNGNYSSNNVSVSQNPGILSPSPANLPVISSAMFSPIENQLGLGFGFGNELIMSNLSFLPSPSSLFFPSAPIVSPSPSPSPSLNDLFNLFD